MADDDARPATTLFEALAESAPDAIVTIDAGSIILSANRAVERLFGHQAESLVGQPLTVLMPEPLRARHRQGFARYLASGTKNIPWTGVHLTGLTRDGREIPVEISFGEFVAADGRRVYSGFIRDISDRVAQQRALQQALDDLRFQAHVLASVEQAIISTDARGVVLAWNEHAERLYGWRASEAIGRRLDEMVPAAGDSHALERATRRLRRGEKVHYEQEVRRRDGQAIWISVHAAPIRDENGRVERIVGTSSDITERRRLEAQFLQAQKMDAVGQLAGGVAHDFNNLLTVIKAHAEFLAAALPPDSEPAADVAEITKATSRAAALTRQLLAFSRQQRMEQKPVDVNRVVGDLEKMLRRVIGVHIGVTLERGLDVPVVLVDPGQLEQAIVNLVVNARDAMPSGGALRITTSRVVARGDEPERHTGTYAAISVADNGHGMTPEVQARVFEPFFTTKSAEKGTGLGLATVYGIVKQSRGFIDVRSAPGKGATFTMHLPETQQTVHAPPPEGVGVVSAGSGTVLLVEDQPEVRRLAARILSGAGYAVVEACDGAEAQALLERDGASFDVVVSDAVMPRLSGPDLMRAVRGRWPRLPFVIMSGYTEDVAGGKVGGATGGAEGAGSDENAIFVQKPFSQDRLLAAVREALGGPASGS